MKRFFSVLLVIAVLACNIPLFSLAAGNGQVSYTLNGYVNEDNTRLDVEIELSDNADDGLWVANLILRFNRDVLSIDSASIELGDIFTYDNAEIEVKVYDGSSTDDLGYLYINNNAAELENILSDGAFVKLSFDIIGSGDYDFTLSRWQEDELNHSAVGSSGATLVPIDFSFNSIITSYEEDLEYTVGDINNDGSINLRDIFVLVTFIKFAATPTETERLVSDVNGDGLINVLDSYEMNYRLTNGAWRN